jgi:hypothetical protein
MGWPALTVPGIVTPAIEQPPTVTVHAALAAPLSVKVTVWVPALA